MTNILFILLLLLIGYSLKRLPAFPKETASVLTSFVIYVSLPALILVQIPKIPFSSEMLVPSLMPWAMLAISAALVLMCAKIFNWSRQITGALMLLVPLGNTSFLGIPMVEAFFGEAMIPYALLYDQVGTFLALATYGSIILAVYSEQEKADFRSILKKIVTFPPLIALLVAFGSYYFPFPAEMISMLESLAATLIPLVIIAVGLRIEFQFEKQHLSPMVMGLGIKLLVAPLLALGIVHLLHINSEAAHVAVFEAGMPPQVSAWALAMMAGLSPKLGAMMVGFGIVISMVTLPLLFMLL